jgi:hypothetical protein
LIWFWNRVFRCFFARLCRFVRCGLSESLLFWFRVICELFIPCLKVSPKGRISLEFPFGFPVFRGLSFVRLTPNRAVWQLTVTWSFFRFSIFFGPNIPASFCCVL